MFEKLKAIIRRKPHGRVGGDDILIPEHERPLGRIFHEAYGTPFTPLKSLDEARARVHAYAILQGDWGGQIYITAPTRIIKCSEAELKQLLVVVDRTEWKCNEGDGAEIFYEELTPGSGVPGGMGGGAATDDVWIHPNLVQQGLDHHIRAVLRGDERSNQGAG